MRSACSKPTSTPPKTGNLPIHVVFLPVSRDELADALAKGRGDIVAAGITVTERG